MPTPAKSKPAPAPAPAAAPVEPRFNPSTAILVPCRRHEPTARTVGFVQPAAAPGTADLFSVGCAYIATVPEAEAAAFIPTAEPAPEPAPAA